MHRIKNFILLILFFSCISPKENILKIKIDREGGAGFRCFLSRTEGIEYYKIHREELRFLSVELKDRNTYDRSKVWHELNSAARKYALRTELKNGQYNIYSNECANIDPGLSEEIRKIRVRTDAGTVPIAEIADIKISSQLKENFFCKYENESEKKDCYIIHSAAGKEHEVREKILNFKNSYTEGKISKPEIFD